MFKIFAFLLIGLFVAMLFVNVYFRAKVLKTYKRLVQNRVEFGAAHLFNRKKMEEEVLPKYPNMRQDILDFSNHIQYSIKMASVLIALITAFGAVLMYFR
ncbi:MAG: hypothetical protein K9J37_15810 [Saprospiraceae bacterium]|nr:hypothetical protein [Saprospiraceae bacterium]MCF8251378.1 hypothetical protein [Saprospiraceae bacterium]MCF8280553.1 hypothetical protein [Bacteroidales bacterium]MCF8313229.1 hypothetical protein [Saprospiraceae bacterium]MCF8441676.1 hypothetical protein [Saprospiraceae bacterium]